MEAYSIVIILLAVAIGLYPIASKTRLPYPILLLVTGIAVGFIPGFHQISISPEVVFLIFLPPMLYDAAFNISYKDFKSNLHIISTLAISLIFITTVGIAVVSYYCIPGMTWPLAFVLGAILSPPDAIAASGVTKGLDLPHRAVTILEGESLINDASALVAFRFAVAAVAGSSFVLSKAIGLFLISLIGGFLAGIIICFIFTFIVKKQRQSTEVTVSLNLLVPFVAYLIAEEFHVSGVIAVVTAGLVISRHKDKFSEQVQIQSKSIWETTIFILGGLIFILIGLEFPHILKNIDNNLIFPLIGCSFLIFLVSLIIRMIFVLWDKKALDKRIVKLQQREKNIIHRINNDERIIALREENTLEAKIKIEAMERNHSRVKEKFKRMKDIESLSFKECFIIGWSGMRGIVSLAAALSLPLLMADGNMFPQRDVIIFLTVVTVIFMLIIQGLGLPLFVKFLKINSKIS